MLQTSKSAPFRNEETGQSDLLAKVEQELADMKREIKQAESPPAYMRAMGREFNDTNMPMNDQKLSESFEFNTQVSTQGNQTQTIKEIVTRLAELEDNQPEFKGLNTWDTPLPLVPSTATLEEVISVINKLIQRSTRQDRLK